MVLLLLESRDGGTGAPLMGRSDETGTFRINGVVPGSYRMMATPTMPVTQSPSMIGAGVEAPAVEGLSRSAECSSAVPAWAVPHPAAHVLFASGDARRACARHPGARGARGSLDHAALHAPESGRSGCWTRGMALQT